MINWWGFILTRLKKRGLRHGSGQKRGVLGTGQVKGGGGLRHGPGSTKWGLKQRSGKIGGGGVFTAEHTCTGHICVCVYIQPL